MGKLFRILLIYYIALNASGCKKDSVQTPPHQLTISNLQYSPDKITIIKPGATFDMAGTIDFSNASGGIATLRLTTSNGIDLTVPVLNSSETSGTLTGFFTMTYPATAGTYNFQAWVIDKGGNISNKLQGSIQAVIDDEGKIWGQVFLNYSGTLSKVIWANQRFMAVGEYGAILISTDPHYWTQLNSGSVELLRGVAWSGMQYIVVGMKNTILNSPDGTIWTSRFSPPAGSNIGFYSIAWSGNGFVAAGFDFNGSKTAIFNSTDGNIWTENTYGVADGIINTVIWANNQYVAVGQANGIPIILTSTDGLSWANKSNAIAFGKGVSLSDITWTGSKYVAVGSGLTATSSDGTIWIVNDNISWEATGVAWSGNRLMATGNLGEIYSSTDGLNWLNTYNLGGYSLESIAWSGFQYVSVGTYKVGILVSPAF